MQGERNDAEGGDTPSASVDPFMDAKLHSPPVRDHWLRRERLLGRLDSVVDHRVTLVAAPAGYGKTVLVAQWLEEADPRAAWVSLDAGDNDVNRLWAHVATALERAGCRLEMGSPDHRVSGDSVAPGSTLTAIVEALGADQHHTVLVLDDFHFIQDERSHTQVEFLVEHLPPQAHLVILTRADPGLRLGRLRASGGLLEIRADALGFTAAEAGAMLSHHSVDLDPESFHLLMRSTEGWPAGLYLASLSLAGRAAPDAFVRNFSDGNRYIGDYLTEEVLNRHSDQVREFIMEVSVLDRFSAPLCDHVRGSSGSAAILRDLERSNLFLMPLDEDRHWYRFHRLLAAVARSELEVSPTRELSTLHARAADWFDRHGYVDEAVKHLIAAGDTPAAGMLVQRHWLQYVDAGRIATVLGWSEAISASDDPVEPVASVTSAWLAALTGDESSLADLMAELDAFRDLGPLPDGSRSVESAMAMIDSLFGYDGPQRMMQGAQRAASLEVDRHSPFYSLAQVALGHAYYVAGDLDQALQALANARHNDRAPVVIQALGLATESLVEDERRQLGRAREHAERAMAVIDGHGLGAFPQASLSYTALGRAQAAAGRVDEALVTLARGLDLRRNTSASGPWGMIHHLLVHARVAGEAGETALATDLLDELDSRTARFVDGMDAVHARTEAVRRSIRSPDVGVVAGEDLTSRETEILRLLQGSMTFPEIAGELYLSSNTIKTHARAVYRKLGVHTRAEAVVAGRRQGLLTGPTDLTRVRSIRG